MRTITTLFAAALFLTACSTEQPQQTSTTDPYASNAQEPAQNELDYWAKDNLDLERVGNLLERSNSPQEFEAYLNEDDNINNLDLNGDGYVDYISVDEFQDRGPNERGLSLFSRFGPDLIQEIAQIFLYRDSFDSPGSRVLLRGNEQIYGDNSYYETNWLDRAVPLVTTLFGNRDDYYRSPYYYDNYPADYRVYEVVETPLYRTRIERLYPRPLFVYTAAPAFLNKIKIKSPNNGLHLGQIYAKLAKPTKEQAEFIKNNPGRRKAEKADKPEKADHGEKGDKGEKRADAPKSDEHPKNDPKPGKENASPGKPPKAEKQNPGPPKAEKQNPGPPKADNPNKGQGQGKGKKP